MFEKPLGLRENPFLAGHHPKYLFPSREHQEALAHLRYGIQNREPFVLITGEVGTGKTTAVYDALAEWGSRAVVALITNSALSRAELLEEICLRFGVAVTTPMSKPQALVELQRKLTEVRVRGELAILLVDEAQNLDRELLEEIRLLSNLEVNGEYLMQIFLVGQPELESKLAQKELRQLRQRIGIHYRILPLNGTDSARYIHHRVSVAGGNAEELFPADTCVEIFRITHGIPREINVVAGQSLLNAFVEDSRSVTINHVRAVEREIEFQSVLRHQAATVETPTEPKPARKKPARAKPSAAAAPPTAILPINRKRAGGGEERPRGAAPPAVAQTGRKTPGEEEMDVEVSESVFGEALPDVDDALVGEFPPGEDPRRPDYGAAETEETGTGPAQRDKLLPSWIDEIVLRRQAMEQWALGRSGAPSTPTAAPTPPPTLTVLESDPGAGPSGGPSPALVAAPPPIRPAAPSNEPIPIFERGGDSAEHLPARVRDKLTEAEEPGPNRRASMLWPIASLVIAAVAIAVLLAVRFGIWSPQRPNAAPATAPAPGATSDSSLHSGSPFPPFEEPGGAGGPSPSKSTRARGQLPPATGGASSPAAGAPVSEDAGSPGSGVAPGQGVLDPSEAAGAGAATPPDPGRLSFGIAVGTYLNEGRANAERTRAGETTQLVSRVVAVAEDSVSMYRVVVGSYGDRITAERAASDLVQRGLVTEARVVAVEPGSEPRQ